MTEHRATTPGSVRPIDDDRPSAPRLRRRRTPNRARRGVVGLVLLFLLITGLAGLALTRGSGAGPDHAAVDGEVLRIAPRAVGAGDGSSWADAGALEDLPRLVGALPSGGEVWLRADDGPFEVQDRLNIARGGTAAAPVVVRGVDIAGRPATAVLRGDRTAPYEPDGDSGGDVFVLRNGAEHLVFRDLLFENVGNAFLAVGDVQDITVRDSAGNNVRRFFENARAEDDRSADVSGLTLRNITVTGFSKRFLRLRNSSHDIVVENVVADSQRQDGDNFAIGVHLEGDVRDVLLRNVRMDNTHDTLRDYWNGDGFATERGVDNVRFVDTSASGNTDAGYDLKSTGTTLEGAVASGNKRNFRFWATDTTAEGCRGTDPVKRGGSSSQAQVWLGEDAGVRLVDCAFEGSSEDSILFDLEAGAELTVVDSSVEHAGRVERLEQGASVNRS